MSEHERLSDENLEWFASKKGFALIQQVDSMATELLAARKRLALQDAKVAEIASMADDLVSSRKRIAELEAFKAAAMRDTMREDDWPEDVMRSHLNEKLGAGVRALASRPDAMMQIIMNDDSGIAIAAKPDTLDEDVAKAVSDE